MLGYQLARAGVPVTVLEKHGDFLRDFRGDTVHPATLQLLAELDLLTEFQKLPIQRVQRLGAVISGRLQPVADFTGLKPFDHIALVPQWDFLNLLAAAGRRYPHFDLRLRHEAVGLLETDGRISGVQVQTPDGALQVHADLVVACDGRASTLRQAAQLPVNDLGAPMDVLWFRITRHADDPDDTFAIVAAGHMMVLINRRDYWQAAYLVPKGGDAELRAGPIEALQASVLSLAGFLQGRQQEIGHWGAVSTLQVKVDRAPSWYQAGLLLIGDAAHAMSPIGGVGINLAIQDAVAAANLLADPLYAGQPIDTALLQQIQQRREWPVRVIQKLQLTIQNRLLSKLFSGPAKAPHVPWLLRGLLRFRAVRRLPARLIGYGLRREHVQTPARPAVHRGEPA